jgi:ribosomal protein S5
MCPIAVDAVPPADTWFPDQNELGQQQPVQTGVLGLLIVADPMDWMYPHIGNSLGILYWLPEETLPTFKPKNLNYITHKEIYVIPPFNWTRTIANTIGITDAISRSVGWKRTISTGNTVGITDSLVRTCSFVRTIANQVNVSDTLTRTGNWVRSIAESVGVTDTLYHLHDAVRAFTDTVGITDAIAVSRVLYRTITDGVGVTDVISVAHGAVRAIADTVGITDVISRVHDAVRTIQENVGVTDSHTVTYKGLAKVFYFAYRLVTFKFWDRQEGGE